MHRSPNEMAQITPGLVDICVNVFIGSDSVATGLLMRVFRHIALVFMTGLSCPPTLNAQKTGQKGTEKTNDDVIATRRVRPYRSASPIRGRAVASVIPPGPILATGGTR